MLSIFADTQNIPRGLGVVGYGNSSLLTQAITAHTLTACWYVYGNV